MNKQRLAIVIREYARAIYGDGFTPPSTAKISELDTAELLRVLSRIIEGKTIEESFGSPGSWGYGTPIGESLRDTQLCGHPS